MTGTNLSGSSGFAEDFGWPGCRGKRRNGGAAAAPSAAAGAGGQRLARGGRLTEAEQLLVFAGELAA